MLLYRGALVYAEDRNHDDRHGMSPVELEVLKYVHNAETTDRIAAMASQLPAKVHATITAPVRAKRGRWIIECPWCFSETVASRDDHRFFCVECLNGERLGLGKKWRPQALKTAAQGQWVKVVWPQSKDEIEALLIMRPDPSTRSWLPSETVADLLAENESNGII